MLYVEAQSAGVPGTLITLCHYLRLVQLRGS